MTGYSTREVAGLLGLTPAQIRRCVYVGLLTPGRGSNREYCFQFSDMVLLRTLKSLRDAHIAPRRAFAALRQLKRVLGESRSLASVRLLAECGEVLVVDDHTRWNALSGQGVLELSFVALTGELTQLRRRPADDEIPDCHDWYELALDLESVDPVRASVAYLIALELEPEYADAHASLARLRQREGREDEARLHYQKALEVSPGHERALFGMGVLLEQAGDIDAAIACYLRADAVPDAHYRLARIFERRGETLAARRHLQRYRQLEPVAED
jgi:tetratricopeptide (TPR) repeat protein